MTSVIIGVRAGGPEGGCSPLKILATQTLWAVREIWAKPLFKDVFKLFLIDRYFLFFNNNNDNNNNNFINFYCTIININCQLCITI